MEPQALPEGVNPEFVVLVNGIYYDLCVICNNNSGVRTYCPVDQRKHYVEGCGQLCPDCQDRADFIT
jgi:hypothetical protein